MTANPELFMRCLQVVALVRIMVMKGINDNEALVAAIDASSVPKRRRNKSYIAKLLYMLSEAF